MDELKEVIVTISERSFNLDGMRFLRVKAICKIRFSNKSKTGI